MGSSAAGWGYRCRTPSDRVQPVPALHEEVMVSQGSSFPTVLTFCLCSQGSQKELLNLTQQDYVNRIEELNQSLKDAWASDQKVKALKIVIQVRPWEGVWFFISSIFCVKSHLILIFRVLPQGLALIHLFCGHGMSFRKP